MEQVIDAIYAAAVDPSLWGPALEAVARYCGASGGSIFVPRLPGAPLESLAAFIGYNYVPPPPDVFAFYAAQDCFSAGMMASVGGDYRKVASILGSRPSDEQLNSAYYQDYCRMTDMGDAMSVLLRAPRPGQATPVLGLASPWGQGSIPPDRMARLQQLAPHLQRAMRLVFEVAPAAALDRALVQTAERSAAPMMLLRQDGRVVWLNPGGEALAVARRGLQLRNGRLGAVDADVNGRLQAVIGRALPPVFGPARVGGEVDVEGPGGGVTCLVLPLGGDNPFRDGVGPCRAVVYLLAEGPEALRGGARLMRLFGLSRSECEVAIALMRGRSPEEISVERRRSIETVRTQVRAVLSKTGMSRVAELARLMPVVRPEATS